MVKLISLMSVPKTTTFPPNILSAPRTIQLKHQRIPNLQISIQKNCFKSPCTQGL
jgi:hypothetical protein